MSDKNIIEKAADVVGNITKFQKQSKLKSAYVEREEFRDSDLYSVYFCYNCIYWMDSMGGKCMIVSDEGPDVSGKVFGIIAPHGCCNGYQSNYSNFAIQMHHRKSDLESTESQICRLDFVYWVYGNIAKHIKIN